jgi:hypothetical protein
VPTERASNTAGNPPGIDPLEQQTVDLRCSKFSFFARNRYFMLLPFGIGVNHPGKHTIN